MICSDCGIDCIEDDRAARDPRSGEWCCGACVDFARELAERESERIAEEHAAAAERMAFLVGLGVTTRISAQQRVAAVLRKAARAIEECRDDDVDASAIFEAELTEASLAGSQLVKGTNKLIEDAQAETELVDELVGDRAFYSHLRDTREEEPNAAE